jgi:phosphotransferase system enzyme I (PtsI)
MATREFRGLAVSPGYGQGPAFVYRGTEDLFAAAAATESEGAERERRRFERALAATRREMEALRRRLREDYGRDAANVMHAQFLMLQDPDFIRRVERRLQREGASADAAVVGVAEEIERELAGVSDPYLRERALDVHDIGARLLRHLADRTHHPLARVPAGVVIVAERLLPSDTIFLDRAKVVAMVTERGSENSHAAILARGLGIPAVAQIRGITGAVRTGDPVVVDGLSGRVVVQPEGSQRDEYTRRARRYEASISEVRGAAPVESVSLDGQPVHLLANIAGVEDAEVARAAGAHGVGLLRTEFLYLAHGGQASEDEQYELYRRIGEIFGGRPVVIRTLDLGPDKIMPIADELPMAHAAITERGIHYSLRHPDLLVPQIRAIVRASRCGNLRILLPMVTGVDEVVRLRGLVDEVRGRLHREGERIDAPLPIGAMIEAPPAVLLAAEICRASDFVSIGSNDLLRYLFSGQWHEGRDEETSLEPSLIRAIDAVVRAASAAGKEVGLCGEMAGTTGFTCLLLGLGLRVLSMSSKRLPEVRYNVRQIDVRRCEALAQQALSLGTAAEIRALVAEHVDPWQRLLDGEAPAS